MTSTATQSKGSPSARFRSQVDIETHGMHACGMGGNAQMHAYTFTRIYTLFWENSTRGQKVVRRLDEMEDKETNKGHLTANKFHSIETKQWKLTTTSCDVTEPYRVCNTTSPPLPKPRLAQMHTHVVSLHYELIGKARESGPHEQPAMARPAHNPAPLQARE